MIDIDTRMQNNKINLYFTWQKYVLFEETIWMDQNVKM